MSTTFNISSTESQKLIVNTDPVIKFDNGMELWLAKKGESFQINSYDWAQINAAASYINMIGKVKCEFVPSTPKTHSESKLTAWQKFKHLLKTCL